MTDQIVTLAGWLTTQLEWMRHRREADEFLADVNRCAQIVRGLARGPHEQKYLGPCGAPVAGGRCDSEYTEQPCPTCEVCEGDVYGPRGGSVGRCRTCGAEVATAYREAWLDAQTRSEAFSARDIADAYRIPVKTIRTWANRGQLRTWWRTDGGLVAEWPPPEGVDREKLHYVGDVLDLATADRVARAERQAARARSIEQARPRKDAA